MSPSSDASLSRSFFAVLVLISMVAPLGMNIILPSLTSFQIVFETDYAMSQLTLTLYLAALAVGQLIYGPLSDQFGRRPMVLTGLLIMMVGTTLCVFSTSIEMLIAGRIVQAAGGCAGVILARAMVRDMFDAERSASLIAYLTMAFVVAPTLAPLIGGFLEDQFGWQGGFVFVLIFALVVFLVALKGSRETLSVKKRHNARFSDMFLSFLYLLKNPVFTYYSLQVSFSTAAYFAFLGGSSFVLIGLMGGTATELGLLFVLVSVFYIGGNFIAARLTPKFGLFRMTLVGTVIGLIGPVLLYVTEITTGHTPLSFFGMIGIVALGNGFCIAPGMAGAIGADPSRVGAAAGLAGSMQVGVGAFSSFVGAALLSYCETSALPLIIVVGVFCLLAFFAVIAGHFYGSRPTTTI